MTHCIGHEEVDASLPEQYPPRVRRSASLRGVDSGTIPNPFMAQIRAIRKRMTAVGTIARITKTMQMIATAKFTAALARAKDSRPYTDAIRNLVCEVSGAAGDYDSPLFAAKSTASKELLLTITSDRGLCGAYNGNVLKKSGATHPKHKIRW